MSSKINLNYDKIIQDALVKKQQSEIDVRAREIAQELAQEEIAKIQQRRENLRQGEDNYYGNALWSRLDQLTQASDQVKRSISDVFDNSTNSLEKARQQGVVREFVSGLIDEVKGQTSPAVKGAYFLPTISDEMTHSWAQSGGQPRLDMEISTRHVNRMFGSGEVNYWYRSANFWENAYPDTLEDLQKELSLHTGVDGLDHVEDFQAGKITADDFIQKTKAVFSSRIDQSLSVVTQDFNQFTALVSQYDSEWKKIGEDNTSPSFSSYVADQVNREINSGADNQRTRHLLNVLSIQNFATTSSEVVSLHDTNELAQILQQRFIPDAMRKIKQEQEAIQPAPDQPQENSGTVLNMDKFPPSTEPSKPWYKKIKLFGS